MKVMDFIIFFFLLIILAFSLLILWDNLPKSSKSYSNSFETSPGIVEESLYSSQFYPGMRYRSKEISFFIDESCSDKKRGSIISAFEIISNKTILKFHESKEGEIRILCSTVSPSPEQSTHFIVGEGGPTEIINTSLYYVIYSGKVSLYRNERCSEPKVALHEILHALGFDHNKNENSIMYEISNCNQIFDDYLVEDINSLYSVSSLPDLAISEIFVNRSGKYVSFNISIINRGLQDAENTKIDFYAGDKFVKDFYLGKISVGIKKSLNVQNLRLSEESDLMRFEVSYPNKTEIFDKNNFFNINLN